MMIKSNIALCALALFAGTVSAAPTLKISNTIAIDGDARWDYLYADSGQHRLYVSHGTQTEVIDTQTNKLAGTIADTNGVHGIAIANDLGLGFTSNGKDNTVTVFELSSLKTRATIKVGGKPDAIIYVPQTQRVVTFNEASKDATVIDAKEGTVLGTVKISGNPEFAQLDASGDIYFNIEDSAELAVLSSSKLQLTQRFALKPCDSPTGLAVDKEQRFYSVCENKLMMVTAHDGKNIAQLPIGAGPDGVAWMDGYAYSANGQDGTLSVIGADADGKLQTVATVPTAIGARTIAADPATHRLYLPTSDYKPAQNGGRRQTIPGTFRILVVDVK
jgi:DNA-binding beta-propeller fold protein YncE